MDKMTFASYRFKPSDVIEGLNRYFAKSKANRYLRVPLEIENGTVKPGNYYVLRNIVFNVYVPKIKEVGYCYLICDPEEVVGVAINWLREEHDIFYTPGMEAPIDDFYVDDSAKEYEKATRKDLKEALQRRLYEAKKRIVALENGHAEKSKIIDYQAARIKDLEKSIAEKDSHIETLKADSYLSERIVKEQQKSNERAHSEMYKARGEKHEFEKKIREALGTVDEYADLIGLVRKLREERDELKEKCDKLKTRANALYGASCDKAPAFLCDVVSYTWEFGSIDTPFPSNSIRVELDLTPTANYKGTFDLEDLKKYIQAYGREKKLSDFETFCKLVDNCIDELCDKHHVVQPDRIKTTRERLDYIFGVLFDYRTLTNSNFNKAEEFRKEKRALSDSLAELRAKIREIYRSVVDDEWDESLGYTSALNDINEEYKRVVHNFEERTADWSKAQQELDRYRLAVGSLLDIPKETRDDINAIERAFTFSKKKYESLQEFRNDVCEIFDIPSSMADNYVLKEIHDIVDRYDELEDFRADICGALDIEGMLGTPKQNDKYILEQVEKMSDDGTRLDRYARLRSNICTALCLGGETDDEDILKRVRMTKDCHDALCKDYAKLHDDYVASQKQVKGFTNRCDSLENLQRDLWEFRRNAIEDLKSRGFCFRPEENETLPEIYDKLLKRYDWAYGEYKDQYRLRQCWHVRWESENERANGVQKALDREREKCRVKDISLETAKKQYEKVCGNLETAECALNGMKSKVRSLQEEKTKVISALGQDIWDDAVK